MLGLGTEPLAAVPELPTTADGLPMPDAATALPALASLPTDDPLLPLPEVPQLQQVVEPEFSQRLLDQVGRVGAVDAVLSLLADGSVAAVNFTGAVDLRVQTVVRRALMQWRYAPLRSAQDHRVRLEFAEGR